MDIHTRVMTYLHPPLTPPPPQKKEEERKNKQKNCPRKHSNTVMDTSLFTRTTLLSATEKIPSMDKQTNKKSKE